MSKNLIPVITRTYTEIYSDIVSDLNKRTPVSVRNDTSTMNIISEIVSRKFFELYSSIGDLILNAYLSTASGVALDRFGELFNISRVGNLRAEALDKTTMMFSIGSTSDPISVLLGKISDNTIAANPATFPDGRGSRIILKAGITVRNANDTTYITTDTIELSDTVTSGLTGIVATGIGKQFNVGDGELRQHNLKEVMPELKEIADSIVCNNIQAISNGASSESDENLRWRISRATVAMSGANVEAIRQAVREIPNISDTLIYPLTYGNGTFTVFVQSQSPVIDDGTLKAVNAAISSVKSAGEKAYITHPDYLGIMSTTTLVLKPNSDTTTIINSVRTTIMDYINNIPIGGQLIINELRARIKNISSDIIDFNFAQLGFGYYNIATGALDDITNLNIANIKCTYSQKLFCKYDWTIVCRAEER